MTKKKLRLHISSDILRNAEMFDRVITSDETWCFQYDTETKWQSMQRKTQISPRPKKACISQSEVKNMLVCFCDHKGIVHYEFIAQGQMVNQHCYLEVLTRLQECVWRKRPGLWPNKWILHHDNAPAHDALKSSWVCGQELHYKNGPFILFTWLSPLWFLALSKIEKCPEGTKICWPFWHPMQCENVTMRYSGKRFSRLFPAVAPSSHKVHSFTRRVFRRWQQLLVHR